MIHITAIIGAVCVVAAYRRGLSDGMRISAGERVSGIKVPKLHKRSTDLSETEYKTILSNIENYDGTNKGQKEIKK